MRLELCGLKPVEALQVLYWALDSFEDQEQEPNLLGHPETVINRTPLMYAAYCGSIASANHYLESIQSDFDCVVRVEEQCLLVSPGRESLSVWYARCVQYYKSQRDKLIRRLAACSILFAVLLFLLWRLGF